MRKAFKLLSARAEMMIGLDKFNGSNSSCWCGEPELRTVTDEIGLAVFITAGGNEVYHLQLFV